MKKIIAMLLSAAMCLSLVACNSGTSTSDSSQTSSIITSILDEEPVSVSVSTSENETSVSASTETSTSVSTEPVSEPVDTTNMYRSELTNEWISKDIENQRPVAIMVDNEKTALPHYGTSDADIVYEMINSTKNDRITRLMCVVKDWTNIQQFGNVRSTRSTNVILAPEYNAILIHDGGPYYINQWFAYKNAKQHLSGGFARFDNGKAWTYKEYVTADSYKGVDKSGNDKTYSGLIARINKAGYETEYNKYYMGKHFTFSETDYTLTDAKKVKTAKDIDIPFPHNKTELHYNEDTKTYDYYEYGSLYVDALYGDEERRMSFKNVFLLKCDFVQLDDNGYLCYYILGGDDGYYLTNGEAIPIKWSKADIESLMTFKDSSGKSITLNTGKTYFAIVPSDSWSKLGIE